jgi:RNA polymerase sigma-70 factor, ECF subfamily
MLTTSASLLGHLQEADDPKAWERFVHLYSPVLYEWATRMGLQHADALDLVQEVFVTLVRKLPEYSYDSERGFRNWLFIITRNKCREKARRKTLRVDGVVSPDDLGDVSDENAAERVERADFHRYLLEHVLPGVSEYFQVTTWRAFIAHVVDGQPASQVALQLGITVNAVLKAKARVLSRLHVELADLAKLD